jgi:phenylalanyl-tRNA synthetase beta chain
MFDGLGLGYVRDAADFIVTPPSHRFDLALEVDLIEELVRLHGYDNIPAQAPRAAMRMRPAPESWRGTDAIRALIQAREFQEVVSYSFVDPEREAAFTRLDPVALLNPIAAHLAVMRTTLMGGLVDVLRHNISHRAERVRVFEIGRAFLPTGQDIDQPRRIAALAWGPAHAEQWGEAARGVDFHDLKADLEALLAPAQARFVPESHPALHPGQSARVWLGEHALGWIGALHPALVQRYELETAPTLFELDLDALTERPVPTYRAISRQPLVRRDLALVVDAAVPAGELLAALRHAAPEFVRDVILFDQYRGKGIDSDKKSIAIRISMQDTFKTLTDAETDAAMRRLLDLAGQQFGATLRV